MQHSLAPGRSVRLMPRFVAPSTHGREARLGLHRMATGMVPGTPGPVRGGRRMALRDGRGMTVAAARPRTSGVLRHEPVLRWARDLAGRRVTASLRAAPWHR
jgi:hypothetical protein